MKNARQQLIICPKCGRQYLPGEIYLPKSFLGQPKYIERDVFGKILSSYNGNMDLLEQYTCDKCNTTFRVKAFVKFNSYIDDCDNANQPYSMKLKNKLSLEEE